MKYTGIFAFLLVFATMLTACKDDDPAPGNPTMEVSGNLGSAHFGDSLRFTVKATDPEVALSTIHAELYFGDEMVVEEIVRTKVSGADYEVVVPIPYLANIPDGNATLRLTLQNIHFTTTEQTYKVALTHPDYPQLIFRTEDGDEYIMEKTDEEYVYAVTDKFPTSINGYIVAMPVDDNAEEIVFGYENSEIKPGVEGAIPFSNSVPGTYTISFNTYSFEGSPFIILSLNGNVLESDSNTTAYIDMTLQKGDVLSPDGFPNYDEWWIDPDYFVQNSDGSLTFNAYGGTYRIIADMSKQYFRIYKLNGSSPATLNSDGTGALWIIGDDIGLPSLNYTVGWVTESAICMAPIGEKTYQITLVGGETINTTATNFKFFGQMGWGVELTGADLVSTSDIIQVGTGSNGHDTGNLFLADGKTLEEGGIYVFTVDLTQGINDAILSVEYKGQKQ